MNKWNLDKFWFSRWILLNLGAQIFVNISNMKLGLRYINCKYFAAPFAASLLSPSPFKGLGLPQPGWLKKSKKNNFAHPKGWNIVYFIDSTLDWLFGIQLNFCENLMGWETVCWHCELLEFFFSNYSPGPKKLMVALDTWVSGFNNNMELWWLHQSPILLPSGWYGLALVPGSVLVVAGAMLRWHGQGSG